MKRTALWIGLVFGVPLTAGAAWADGLPVLGVDVGGTGVVAPAGDARYVTLPAGGSTIVARVSTHGGRVLGSRLLSGTFTIPAVAYDGTASGLSRDGRTLVLINPRARFPRSRTSLLVLDAQRLRPRSEIRLRGDFSYDAVSPSARWLYLIQYVSPVDPTRYLVRTYDLRAGRLLAEPVTDPRERGEKMRGSPITRTASADGRWAYTLYDGGGKVPFIHALDTAARSARCIDLDAIPVRSVSRLRLRLNDAGDTLSLNGPSGTVATIDTRTFEVSAASRIDQDTRPGGFPWAFLTVSIAGVLAAGLGLSLALRRRREAPAVVQAPARR